MIVSHTNIIIPISFHFSTAMNNTFGFCGQGEEESNFFSGLFLKFRRLKKYMFPVPQYKRKPGLLLTRLAVLEDMFLAISLTSCLSL